MWQAFSGFLEPESFARVYEFLNLEEAAMLMICNRSLREIGQGAMDWALAVRQLSSKNTFNLCLKCDCFIDRFTSPKEGNICECTEKELEDDVKHRHMRDWVQLWDPRHDANFSSRPASVQFGQLYTFQRMCVNNLLDFYQLEDLGGPQVPHILSQVHFGPPEEEEAVNLRKKIHTFLDKCPSRIRMLDKVVQLALASYDLGPKLTWRTGPRLFRGAFCAAGEELAQRFSQMAEMKSVTIPPSFEYAREGWLFVVMTQSIRDTARKVCGMANAPGNELSDENFKEFIDYCYGEIPHLKRIDGLGSDRQDAIDVMGKLRANFGQIAASLEPLPAC